MIIREAEIEDAKRLVKLFEEVDASSDYMLWEAGERQIGVEQQKKLIQNMRERKNSTILIAENSKKELDGYLFAMGGNAKRNKHSVYIVIGILEKSRGQGVGTLLFQSMEKWAKANGIQRLELTVITENKVAIALYNKMGFEIEGTKINSLKINDKFVDEYYMAKIISLA